MEGDFAFLAVLSVAGIRSSMHMGGGPPQYGNMEDMVSELPTIPH